MSTTTELYKSIQTSGITITDGTRRSHTLNQYETNASKKTI